MKLLPAFFIGLCVTTPLSAQNIVPGSAREAVFACVAFDQPKYFSPYYSLRINNVERGRYLDKYACIKAQVKEMKKRDKVAMQARKKLRTDVLRQTYVQGSKYSAPDAGDKLEREWYERALLNRLPNRGSRKTRY